MHDLSMERQQLLHYEEVLRSAGQFVTVQRRALLRYLLRHQVHPTTAEIASAIGRSGSASLATVYNNLALFAELRIVRTLRSPKGEVHWDIRTDRHHHLVCSSCARVEDLAEDQVGITIQDPAIARRIERTEAWLIWSCPRCTQES
jgi:Fur family peroxide stress response transcriptional regulator